VNDLVVGSGSAEGHNSLGGLQGGSTNERYHFTHTQHDTLTNGSNADGLHSHTIPEIPDHNDLDNIQGGSPTERYHLTLTEKNSILASGIQTFQGVYDAGSGPLQFVQMDSTRKSLVFKDAPSPIPSGLIKIESSDVGDYPLNLYMVDPEFATAQLRYGISLENLTEATEGNLQSSPGIRFVGSKYNTEFAQALIRGSYLFGGPLTPEMEALIGENISLMASMVFGGHVHIPPMNGEFPPEGLDFNMNAWEFSGGLVGEGKSATLAAIQAAMLPEAFIVGRTCTEVNEDGPGQLTIQGGRSFSSSYYGGSLYLAGGDATTQGGNINIRGGNGDTGVGGNVYIEGGYGATGGYIQIGPSYATGIYLGNYNCPLYISSPVGSNISFLRGASRTIEIQTALSGSPGNNLYIKAGSALT
jgi:hypothetical protein